MSKNKTSFALGCLLLLVACSGKQKTATDPGGDQAQAAAPVQVATARRDTIQHIITAEAVLYPVRQASIVPKISAPVQRFFVQRGGHVRQGQTLAVLENRDLAAAAEESKNLYQQAQAAYQNTSGAIMPEDLLKARTDAQSARQALDAAVKLYENRQTLLREGALAQKLVDDAKVAMVQAQSQFETAQQHLKSLQTVGQKEQLNSARAQLDAAKAHYQSAEAQLSYAEVLSPITGIVSDRPLNVGELASTGSALISIVDISRVVARANIPVHEAAAIQPGRPAAISGPGGKATGKVTVVSPAVDPNTTTVQVWVEAANSGERFKPGITVQISITAGEIQDAIMVPSAALLSSDDGGQRVMVAGSDSLAHERKVEVGARSGDQVQILSGVSAGEQVLIEGALGLDDKAKIQIVKAPPEGEEKTGEGEK